MIPFAGGYHVWTNRITYDHLRDRFFLGYYDESMQTQLSKVSYRFYRFYWPDVEERMTGGKNGDNTGLPVGAAWPHYTPGPCEFNVLMSKDLGQTWSLATTPDFQPK